VNSGTSWELLERPPYSSDLAPNDFYLFGLLKIHLGGKRFTDDEEVETDVQKWRRQQSKDFNSVGLDAPVKR
jgi:transposase